MPVNKHRPDQVSAKTKLFKHKSFNEQLSNVSINYIKHLKRRIGYKDEEDDDQEVTYFYECLEKWMDLDCTEDFFQLHHKLGGLLGVRTLAQLIHRQDDIIRLLEENLSRKDHKAFPALIELVIALAKDIQHDFYPHFGSIFQLLLPHLNTQKVDIIENVFLCFAYLFKILWKDMVRDIRDIFVLYAQHLLDEHKRDYIVMFASQSFSFLVRKCDDFDQLMHLLFDTIRQKPELTNGVGYLIFEAVKGVQGQLHGIANDLLSSLVKVYAQQPYAECSNCHDCVHYCFEALANYISRNHVQIVWDVITPSIGNESSSVDYTRDLVCRLRLIRILVDFKKCVLVKDGNGLVKVCTRLIADNNSNDHIRKKAIEIGSILIQNMDTIITIGNIQALVNAVFNSVTKNELIFEFCEQLFLFRFFERDLLPAMVKFVASFSFDSPEIDSLIQFLCRLIRRKASKIVRPDGGQVVGIDKYCLNVGSQFGDQLCNSLLDIQQKGDLTLISDQRKVWTRLFILPHLKPLDSQKTYQCFVSLFNECRRLLLVDVDSSDNCVGQRNQISFLLCEIMSAILLLNIEQVFVDISIDNFVELIASYPDNYSLLKAFDLYLNFASTTNQKENVFKLEAFESIYYGLQTNLYSSRSKLRMTTLSICCQFNPTLPALDNVQTAQELVFQICLDIERVSVMDYKEKLRLINKLEYGIVTKNIPIASSDNHCKYDLAPVFYLLGALYMNCTPLWTPIQETISTYAIGLKDSGEFWKVFLDHNQKTDKIIYDAGNDDGWFTAQDNPDQDQYLDMMNQHFESDDRPDHLNHRLQIINTLKLIPHVIEKHNKHLVDWFFEFVQNEDDIIDINFTSHVEDILAVKDEEEGGGEEEEEEEQMETDEIEFHSQEPEASDLIKTREHDHHPTSKTIIKLDNSKAGRQKRVQTFVAFLNLFSEFRNPNAIHNEPKLRKLYYDLLKSRHTDIQREAYNCIRSYKLKFLIPYYENMERLINTTEFKSEMVRFNVSSTNAEDIVLQKQHRSDLVPIMMRILYGKMLHDFSSSKEGLTDNRLKKKLIFRYIAGFQEEEIRVFFNISFVRFEHYFDLDYESMAKQIQTIDLKSIIPIKQITSTIQNLDYMLENLASLCTTLLPLFYRTMIIVLKYVNRLLDNRKLIKKQVIHSLRQSRSDVYKSLIKFFHQYPDYEYKDEDIRALFDTDFEHSLPHLALYSINVVNPQMRLFAVWSQHANHFAFLDKHIQSQADCSPLKMIMKLYHQSRACPAVINLITEIINRLLTNEEDRLINHTIDERDEEITFGTSLLIPHIDVIIERFEVALSRRVSKKKSQGILSETETSILLNIGQFIRQEKSCFRLVKILISSLPKNQVSRNEDVDLNTFNVIANLVVFVKQDLISILASLVPFFDLIADKSGRLKLCEIVNKIAQNDAQFEELSQVLRMINSYSRRSLDTPDFEQRIEGFTLAKSLLAREDNRFVSNQIFLSLIIKNCVFFIKNSEDYAVRSQSISMLNELVDRIVDRNDNKMFNVICIDMLLTKEIRHAFKSPNDMIKLDFVDILSVIIRKGRHKHKYCEQMQLLANEEDPEQDFWINIFHIQTHRRTKAIWQLLNNPQLLEQISLDILMMFVLPMTLNNIFDLDYSKNLGLKDASINLLGVICQHLNWKNYLLLLRQYLKKLELEQEDHKTIIKLICTIMNNFRFDLSEVPFAQLSRQNRSQNAFEPESILQDNNLELDEVTTQNLNRNKNNPNEIYLTIVHTILPKLHQTLHKSSGARITYEDDRRVFAEDEEILRLPIAIAMVKLLKMMPNESKLLETNIRGIVLRVANFLKSRAISVREASRKTLVTITQIAGPYYLNYILIELRSLLTRGYMFHVLTFTVAALLESLADQFQPQDLDPSIELLLRICNDELFTNIAEEKDVLKITGRIAEARKVKSYEIFKQIGRFMSTHNLVQIYLPFKQQLIDARSHKVLTKIDNCLSKVGVGLIENRFISLSHLLLFIRASVEDTIPQLKLIQQTTQKVKSHLDRPDSLLIEPAKKIKVIRTNVKTNLHVLLLHHLQIVHLLLKRAKSGKNDSTYDDNVKLLQPLVPILIDQLDKSEPKIVAMALRCLRTITIKYRPAIVDENEFVRIKNQVFVLLNKYGSYVQGENLDMKVLCFKMITVLLAETNVKVSNDQLRILLFYCDQDLADNTKQAQAFTVLNAILDRQLKCDELREMMLKLREMLIQSSLAHIRQRCRISWFKYLLNYPIGMHLDSCLTFFTRQLDYPDFPGRESVLRLFVMLIRFCPNVVLFKLAKISLLSMAMRIINDDQPSCRKLAAKCIFSLMKKLPLANRDTICRGIFLPWFEEQNLDIRQLGAHVLGILCDAEGADFVQNRHQDLLPILERHLNPDQYSVEMINEEQDEIELKKFDHLIYALLVLVKKQIKNCPQMIRQTAYAKQLGGIWQHLQSAYMTHSHVWVRITALQLFETMFLCYTSEEIMNAILDQPQTDDFVLSNPISVVWNYYRCICSNLRYVYEIQHNSELIMRNFGHLLKLFSHLETADFDYLDLDDERRNQLRKLNGQQLIKKLIFEINAEIKWNTKVTVKRQAIYVWLREAIKFKFTDDQVFLTLDNLMEPLVRDVTDRHLIQQGRTDSTGTGFMQSTQRVLNALKKRVGEENFNQSYTKVLLILNKRRTKRKTQKALSVVLNPMVVMKMKVRKRQQARESKKRKSVHNFRSTTDAKRRRTEF